MATATNEVRAYAAARDEGIAQTSLELPTLGQPSILTSSFGATRPLSSIERGRS
jgi:hypothetical protein